MHSVRVLFVAVLQQPLPIRRKVNIRVAIGDASQHRVSLCLPAQLRLDPLDAPRYLQHLRSKVFPQFRKNCLLIMLPQLQHLLLVLRAGLREALDGCLRVRLLRAGRSFLFLELFTQLLGRSNPQPLPPDPAIDFRRRA